MLRHLTETGILTCGNLLLSNRAVNHRTIVRVTVRQAVGLFDQEGVLFIQMSLIKTLALPVTRCVICNKLPNLPKTQFYYVQIKIKMTGKIF